MSVMNELSVDIREMMAEGFAPATIARILEIPTAWVYDSLGQATDSEDLLEDQEQYSPFETVNS